MEERSLSEWVQRASEALQEIQNVAGRKPLDAARVQFPRGYLTEIGKRRLALGFVRSNTVRNNVAYTLMLHDVHMWILGRTDLAGLASDMVIKSCLATLGSVAEALITDATTPPLGKRQKFSSRADYLVTLGATDEMLAEDLKWLWDMRCRQHLFELTETEFDFYSQEDLDRAVDTVRRLLKSLDAFSKRSS